MKGNYQVFISTMHQNNAFVDCDLLKEGCQLLDFIVKLILCLYDYNMHVECLLPASSALVTLLILEQCSQFERFHLQNVQIANKTSSFKTQLIGNNAKASRVNHNTLWCLTFWRSRQQTSCYKLLVSQFWAEELVPPFNVKWHTKVIHRHWL